MSSMQNIISHEKICYVSNGTVLRHVQQSMCMRALTYVPNTFNTKFGKHLRAPALLVKPLQFQCNVEFWKKRTSWNTGSHCSLIPMASAFPVTSPSGSTVKYFPYPDFKAIFVSDTCTAVNISSASGPSPVQILRTCSTMLRLNALKKPEL